MSYPPSTVFGFAGISVLVVSGILGAGVVLGRRYQPILTRYHLPAILLVLLAITVGVTAVVVAGSLSQDTSRIDYAVEPCNESFHGPPDSAEQLREFHDLSLHAQDVFLSALRSEGEYTTLDRPSDFDYISDTTEVNYVQYESTCYVLTAEGPGPLAGVGSYVLLVGGGAAAVALLVVGLGSLVWPTLKVPLSVLTGLTGTAVLVAASVPSGRQLLAVVVGIPVVTWLALGLLERWLDVEFHDRMRP